MPTHSRRFMWIPLLMALTRKKQTDAQNRTNACQRKDSITAAFQFRFGWGATLPHTGSFCNSDFSDFSFFNIGPLAREGFAVSLVWVAEQIAKATANAGQQPAPPLRFNPKPPGVIREGSATEATLRFLVKEQRRWLPRQAIVTATARTDKAVDWALIFLRDQGLVEVAHQSDGRNSRFHKYRASAVAVAASREAEAQPSHHRQGVTA